MESTTHQFQFFHCFFTHMHPLDSSTSTRPRYCRKKKKERQKREENSERGLKTDEIHIFYISSTTSTTPLFPWTTFVTHCEKNKKTLHCNFLHEVMWEKQTGTQIYSTSSGKTSPNRVSVDFKEEPIENTAEDVFCGTFYPSKTNQNVLTWTQLIVIKPGLCDYGGHEDRGHYRITSQSQRDSWCLGLKVKLGWI